jgi:hypothetical protein
MAPKHQQDQSYRRAAAEDQQQRIDIAQQRQREDWQAEMWKPSAAEETKEADRWERFGKELAEEQKPATRMDRLKAAIAHIRARVRGRTQGAEVEI